MTAEELIALLQLVARLQLRNAILESQLAQLQAESKKDDASDES